MTFEKELIQSAHEALAIAQGRAEPAAAFVPKPNMKTDWNLIRAMMGAAIDACERIEAAGYTETDRDATIDVEGQQVSVHDFLVSAWTLPENLRYQIIRERHDQAADLPYVPEAARVLVAMAQASAELIGAGETTPAGDGIQKMIQWFENDAGPGVEQAVADRRRAGA